MKIIKIPFLLSITAILISAFAADVPTETRLRLDIPKGETLKMSAEMNMDYYSDKSLSNKIMSMEMLLDHQYSVEDRLENGIHAIDYKITRLRLNQAMGAQQVVYDSDSAEEAGPMAAMIHQQFSSLLNTSVPFKVNSLGKVVEKPEMSTDVAFDIEQLTDQIFIEFPEEPVQTDYTWSVEKETKTGNGSMKVVAKYTVTAITDKRVSVQTTVTPTSIEVEGIEQENMNLEQAGNMMLDRKTGKLLSMSMNQSMAINDPTQGEVFIISTTEIKTE